MDTDKVLDRRSFTLPEFEFEFPARVFWGSGDWDWEKGEKRSRNPLDPSGFSCRSEADVSEDEEESLRRCAEAERRRRWRNMGKKEEPPFEFELAALRLSGTESDSPPAFVESSDVFRDPEGVLEGLRAKTGTSVKCSEGIRI